MLSGMTGIDYDLSVHQVKLHIPKAIFIPLRIDVGDDDWSAKVRDFDKVAGLEPLDKLCYVFPYELLLICIERMVGLLDDRPSNANFSSFNSR